MTSIEIPAPLERVWNELARLEHHVEWMADAESIEFLTETTSGEGTRIKVETRFGPLRSSDVMEFTAWDPPRRMAVSHQGLFTGSGEFLLEAAGPAQTVVTWREHIRFPWFFGGPVGSWAARPVFRWVWRRNLGRLRERVRTAG